MQSMGYLHGISGQYTLAYFIAMFFEFKYWVLENTKTSDFI
jgi:hypothetical protein